MLCMAAAVLLQVSAVQEGARKGEEGRRRWQVHLGQHDDRPSASRPAMGTNSEQFEAQTRLFGSAASQLHAAQPACLFLPDFVPLLLCTKPELRSIMAWVDFKPHSVGGSRMLFNLASVCKLTISTEGQSAWSFRCVRLSA